MGVIASKDVLQVDHEAFATGRMQSKHVLLKHATKVFNTLQDVGMSSLVSGEGTGEPQ